ncbi:hypothetical protein KK062_03440 [Fulvivirgaceae bacterium PWU5]|uniref:Uncharacterized protein n=1 Tax=Dawidia cretensis TaxID=2782350 RepID=A0AAP2DU31_9BACT|nr:hypothetical protein [Dawidia cretensis]MBT1707256.1 hypothetical protein [Dawidia cretensis]
MITTFYFIQLIAFQLWYITSEQVDPPAYLRSLLRHKQACRILSAALLLAVAVLFVVRFGWMTGICASIIGLMGVGSLAVLVNPFRYVNETGVVVLYAFFLMLEFLI